MLMLMMVFAPVRRLTERLQPHHQRPGLRLKDRRQVHRQERVDSRTPVILLMTPKTDEICSQPKGHDIC